MVEVCLFVFDAQRSRNDCRVSGLLCRTKGSIERAVVVWYKSVKQWDVEWRGLEGLEAMLLYDAGANVAAKRKFAAIQWAAL